MLNFVSVLASKKRSSVILANEVNFLVIYVKCEGHISQSHLYRLVLRGVYNFISLNSKIQDVLTSYSLTLENVNTPRNCLKNWIPKLFLQRNLHPSGVFLILNFEKKTLIARKCGANEHKTYVREGKGTKLLKPHRSYLSMASITFIFQSQAYLKILRSGMYSPLDLTSL